LIERIRLNGVDSFYRGTLLGAGRLALMQHYASTPDEPEIDPQTRRWRDQLRKDYPQVIADLARYDRIRGFGNASEFRRGGARTIGRRAADTRKPGRCRRQRREPALASRQGRGAFNAAVDPVVQGLNIKAGVQDDYDPWRIAVAGGAGIVTGAAAKSAAEALSRTGGRTAFANYEAFPNFGTSERSQFGSPPSSFHYTFGKETPSITSDGLRAGSYMTPSGTLSPLQAHIDLALPPNRGLPDALIRVDLAGLRRDGYEIPAITRVGRSYGMPGGGYEMKFPYEIPPWYIKVMKP
jgi:hypothetical protein